MNESPALRKNWLQRKLARSTSTGSYLPEIDGLRCLAILAVIVFHIAGYVSERSPRPFSKPASRDLMFLFARTGHIGVQLFFIVSGFVVALPFATQFLTGGNKVDLRQYFLRRLIRIEPSYIIALIFWLLAFGISGLGPAPWREMLWHFPASLFYLHNLTYKMPSIIVPPAWSLEIEIQFYLIAPVLVRVFLVRSALLRRTALGLAIFAVAFAQRWMRNPGQINGLHLGQEAHYFLIGLLLVDFHVCTWRHAPPRVPLLGDLLATFCVVATPWALIRNPGEQMGISMLLVLGCAGMLRSHYFLALLRNVWIYTIGGMCYTIYLYHGFFKSLAGHFTIRLQFGNSLSVNLLLQSAILIPLILAGSAVLFVAIENHLWRCIADFAHRHPRRLRSKQTRTLHNREKREPDLALVSVSTSDLVKGRGRIRTDE